MIRPDGTCSVRGNAQEKSGPINKTGTDDANLVLLRHVPRLDLAKSLEQVGSIAQNEAGSRTRDDLLTALHRQFDDLSVGLCSSEIDYRFGGEEQLLGQ